MIRPGRSCVGAPLAVCAWHATIVTTPSAAAWMTVPFGAARSLPLWVGRDGVRNPELIRATSGTVQPDAAIWPRIRALQSDQ